MKNFNQFIEEAKTLATEVKSFRSSKTNTIEPKYSFADALKYFKEDWPSTTKNDIQWEENGNRYVNTITGVVVNAAESTKPSWMKIHSK